MDQSDSCSHVLYFLSESLGQGRTVSDEEVFSYAFDDMDVFSVERRQQLDRLFGEDPWAAELERVRRGIIQATAEARQQPVAIPDEVWQVMVAEADRRFEMKDSDSNLGARAPSFALAWLVEKLSMISNPQVVFASQGESVARAFRAPQEELPPSLAEAGCEAISLRVRGQQADETLLITSFEVLARWQSVPSLVPSLLLSSGVELPMQAVETRTTKRSQHIYEFLPSVTIDELGHAQILWGFCV